MRLVGVWRRACGVSVPVVGVSVPVVGVSMTVVDVLDAARSRELVRVSRLWTLKDRYPDG